MILKWMNYGVMFDKNICRVNIFLTIKVFDDPKGQILFFSLAWAFAAAFCGCCFMRDEVFLQLWWLPAPVQASHPNDQSPRSESLLCKWLVWQALILSPPPPPPRLLTEICVIMSNIYLPPMAIKSTFLQRDLWV